ncbi:ABC transporter permease [Spiroplasma sp. BIUS-1]|uniref:ABC transporter permease n=1 Tax=Spiroplasma sp. BIUS-1 TaxID=216964 RepID=UPI001397A6A6|nr:hypothetical protein [Spiroplasma sp. BIUS-1]QHX36576.1 hypothetical protein SBIUS_v1c03230 [Spiroplasma sp. BIUS-1]
MLKIGDKYRLVFNNQLIIFKNNWSNIIWFSILAILTLVINVTCVAMFNSNNTIESKYIMVNMFIILNSIIFMVGSLYFSLSVIFNQLKNGIHKLELKVGINIKIIYIVRVLFILALMSTLLLINLIFSALIFIIYSSNNASDILVYRLLISSIAWYSIWVLFSVTITILFSVLFKREGTSALMSSLMGFLMLVNVVITPMFGMLSNNSHFKIDTTNKMAFKISYKNKLTKEIKSSNNLENLFKEMRELNLSDDELIDGYKLWNLSGDQKAENFKSVSEVFEKTYYNSNLLKWDDVIGFKNNTLFNEKIKEVSKYGMNKNKNNEYHDVFEFIYNNSDNMAYFKYLGLGYTSNENEPNRLQKIKEKYKTPEEYLMNRVLTEKLLYSSRDRMFSTSMDLTIIFDNIKEQRLKNILNPLNHFCLMFSSVDYKNDPLINVVGTQQMFFNSIPNIKVKTDKDKPKNSEKWEVKRDIKVEVIYIIYASLFVGLITSSYFIFRKKVFLI